MFISLPPLQPLRKSPRRSSSASVSGLFWVKVVIGIYPHLAVGHSKRREIVMGAFISSPDPAISQRGSDATPPALATIPQPTHAAILNFDSGNQRGMQMSNAFFCSITRVGDCQ